MLDANFNRSKYPIIGTVVSLYDAEIKKSIAVGIITGYKNEFSTLKAEVKWQVNVDPMIFGKWVFVISFEDYLLLNSGIKKWEEIEDIFITPEMF